ncbi:galactose oxidase [Schizophyllum commune Loenen D]|nr:galactose oxidase [Schizophyllum commune Loenen D]
MSAETTPLKGTLTKVHTSIPRALSSHSLAIVGDYAYVFGGEQQARSAVDNSMHAYALPSASERLSAAFHSDYDHIVAEAEGGGPVPPQRVGHTAATVGTCIYVFGGRSGPTAGPLEEHGRVWVFKTESRKWTHLDPAPTSPFPCGRSYHAAVGTDASFKDASGGGAGTIFVHAGCAAKGRLNDTWAFDLTSRIWTKLPDAPPPPRSGAMLAFARGMLWRFGGFDGAAELGGQLEFFDMRAPHQWGSVPIPDGQGPGARSMAGMQPMITADGKEFLIVFGGERCPCAKGRSDSGKFWGDVWAYALNGAGSWREVKPDTEEDWGERGWFASAGGIRGGSAALLWGGINAQNKREDDGWLLSLR